ncbi:hypothetical protein BDP27DRAFT_1311099 [Rhodocollybia butyracea]|uniref:Peroxin/Ferlin domain-containing protein n=1 Tax=Rhodocollybia butyracea TaxID=206335 RepID=A0A9P5Q8X3_9AGAR|nr:hypothetical protein BDP27DRAFT_1311099 [Rhodocollybia butyracea]
MATLDYISVPSCASRLQNQRRPSTPENFRHETNDVRPAPKLRISLPHPPPDSLQGPTSPLKSFAANSAFNLLPQVLLSSSLPLGSIPADSANPKRFRNIHQEPVALLSNKDPLSIQVTSLNFKRFVERVGPVFWLQDRIEEIVCWRKGWKVTGTWLAAYGFLCYFPRLVFILPNLILVAVILASVYRPAYKPAPPSVTFSHPQHTGQSQEASTTESPLPAPVAEDSVDWQANIQAIQNLMGFYADLHIAITPYLVHLSLSPNNPQVSKPGPKSLYTLPLLTILILTLPPWVFLVTSAYFPTGVVCFVCGAAPVLLLNPQVLWWCSEVYKLYTYLHSSIAFPIPPTIRSLSSRFFGLSIPSQLIIDSHSLGLFRKQLKMRIQRIIDDNNLSDQVWNSEIREVELWENERLDPGNLPLSPSSGVNTSPTLASRILSPPPPYSKPEESPERKTPARPPLPQHQHQRSRSTFFGTSSSGGWSKSYLQSNDRAAWTRGRDGWSGIAGSGNDTDGTVSSNLTFSLAPNWEFVPTEGWRADLVGDWVKESGDEEKEEERVVRSVLGADKNGWVYSNDVWLVPADHAYSGAVTRRRRWVRRIWYHSSADT